MIVRHNKTGNLYDIVNDECKAKINGEWVKAIIYRGKDKETGKTTCFVREKSDFDSHFTSVGDKKSDYEYSILAFKIYELKKLIKEYPGKTIDDIIARMEARKEKIGKNIIQQ